MYYYVFRKIFAIFVYVSTFGVNYIVFVHSYQRLKNK